MWPDSKLLDLIGTQLPIVQAPMAGASGSAMALAVCEAGGLGSLPCAMLSQERAHAEISAVQLRTTKPFNVNFFCHDAVTNDVEKEAAWKEELHQCYVELGLDVYIQPTSLNIAPFD
jgi:nitronate monooxygenase